MIRVSDAKKASARSPAVRMLSPESDALVVYDFCYVLMKRVAKEIENKKLRSGRKGLTFSKNARILIENQIV